MTMQARGVGVMAGGGGGVAEGAGVASSATRAAPCFTSRPHRQPIPGGRGRIGLNGLVVKGRKQGPCLGPAWQ